MHLLLLFVQMFKQYLYLKMLKSSFNCCLNFRSITLKPGDCILTGTPSGVGMHRKPAEFLSAGDLIESEIESIGKIRNRAVADTA